MPVRFADAELAELMSQPFVVSGDLEVAAMREGVVERAKAVGFGLTADGVRFFSSQWVPDQNMWSDPGVSPLHAPDLRGMPPALIVTAEHDPLRDEGEAFAERLLQAGVPVELRREEGLVHSFMLMDHVSPACAAAVDRIAADIHARLSSR